MSQISKSSPGASIAEIAALAQVSARTVARVLSASGGVSAERRRAVQESIAVLARTQAAAGDDERPFAARTVGVLVQSSESSYYRVLLSGIERGLGAGGYLMQCVSGEWCARQEADQIRRLATRQAAGVILPSGMLEDTQLLRLAAELPIVVTGRDLQGPRLKSISVDNFGGAMTAVRHLIALGHRRIAHIAGPPNLAEARERAAGYRAALEEAGLRFDPALVVQGGFRAGGGLAAIHALLERANAFTAVFAGNDLSACGARKALLRYGIRVPDDVSLIGFDDLPEAIEARPALTTIRQPVFELGHAAAAALIALIEVKEDAAVALPALELVVRESTRRLRF